MEIFGNKKRSIGLISDILYEYPKEKKILCMLFNEGIYSILDTEQVYNEDIKFLKARLIKFMEKLGMDEGIRKNIAETLVLSFVSTKNNSYNTLDEYEIGKVYFIAEENSPEKELRLYQIESEIQAGSGLFYKKGISTYVAAMNATTDAYRYLHDKCDIPGIKEAMISKDFKLTFRCINGKEWTPQVEIGTLLALCSGAIGQPVLSGLIVFGKMNLDEKTITVENLVRIFEICVEYQARYILLPITVERELQKVAEDLLGKISMIFYSSLEDMIVKALNMH